MAEDKKEEKKKNGKNNIKSDTNSEKNISSKKKKIKKRVKKDENQDLKREIDTKEIDTKEIDTKISGKTTKRKKKNKKEKDNINTKKIDDLDDIDNLGKKDDIVIKSKDEKRIVLDAVGKVKVDDVETEEQLDLLQQKTNEKLKEIEDIDKASLETEDDEIEEKEKFEENVQKKVIEKLGKSHKRKVAIITILLFMIAISLVSTIFSMIYMGKDIIAPNIYLGSINIGGLTKEEAKEKIAKRYEEKSNKEIKAVLKDYEQIIKPEMVEFNADINKLVDLAYMEGRNGNIIENNYTIISRYFNKKNLEISYNINEELMQKLLEEIAVHLQKSYHFQYSFH